MMNPVFWFFVILTLIVVWGAVCILFKPLGRIAKTVRKTIEEQMKEDENE